MTWIINLVKWNAGHSKYKFDENALAGHKIMNHALIQRPDEDTIGGGTEEQADNY